ncbi:hypothetical protein COHA_004697 [Chlorella ohadii]|uniref:Uncharacterized protein n=1 Tax=Chlorella ohadii TaxID=2649997 RepID=A0AAD5DR16_9CHLO|nr:hypothetical protein COHA_004697 [Chlorella ohadii]
MAPRTRLQISQGKLKLLQLPDGCLEKIVSLAAHGSWKERCRLAEVCRTFRGLFDAQAYKGRPLRLNLNSLSWRLLDRKGRPAARRALLALLARVAPSVRDLHIRYQLDSSAGLTLEALLTPLAPHVQRLEVEDGLCAGLLRVLGKGWPSLQEVSLVGANLWIDFEAGELARLERQLASMPQLAAKIVHFEGSCQGMPEGEETFFRHLTNLRSLELEDWAVWDLPRDYSPLHAMPHLTRLTLNIVEELESNMPALLSLTQVSELALLGCYRASRGLAQLSNLVQLDLQPGVVINDEALEEPEPEAGAAWKCSHLTELRWCGDLAFDAGEHPVSLPQLVSLEVDECYFPPDGFPLALCLTQLTSLRLVGGRCTRLPPGISQLQSLQVLAIDSCPLPAIPPSISCLTAVTNLQLANTQLKPHLPAWVLGLPIRKLWLSNNQLHNLLPARGGNAARKEEWLGRLTHISAKTTSAVAEMPSLRSLRLEKSYWLRLEDRWSQASLRAIKRLQERRPDVQVDYQHHALPGGLRTAW